MRYALIAALALLGAALPASAQVGISISINAFPSLQVIPGYPVYYAPGLDYNYFFYDGLYWVYQDDNWYSSPWYDGPWDAVDPFAVPVFMLQVPVRYYRRPPVYFRGWQGDYAPHWGDHWGRSWQQRRSGWDHRPEGRLPPPAPLPDYQRRYSGNNYPGRDEQRRLQQSNAPRTSQPDRSRAAIDRPPAQRPGPDSRNATQPQRPALNPRPETPQPSALPPRRPQQQPTQPYALPQQRPQQQPQRPAVEQRTPQQQQRPGPEQLAPHAAAPDRPRPGNGPGNPEGHPEAHHGRDSRDQRDGPR